MWSPPWHLYIFLLANLLAFYLTYLLAFYLAYLMAFYLAYLLAYLLTFYLTYLLTFFLAYLLTFCLAYLLTFCLTFFLAFYLAYLLTFYLTSFLTFFPLRSGSAHCDLEVAVGVRQCPLRSGSRGWGPAVPIATWKSRLRSGSAHCDLQLAVEVRQCPLGSGARSGGPAVPTGIWTARRRRRVRRRRRRRRRRALLKSSNPHLAGGEQTPHVRSTFGRSDVVSRGRHKRLWTLSKVSKTWRFCSISKKDGRRGTFEEDLQNCIFRGRRSTRDMFIRAVRRSGRWFPEKGCILEPQIFRFAEIILRDRCSTSYDLASLFRGKRTTLDRWSGKIAKRIGTRSSALHSSFHVWRKSRRIALFLMLSTSKNEEVSQNLLVFCCQVQKLRKSRWIAASLMLQSSKAEEVSQNSFVFKLADW